MPHLEAELAAGTALGLLLMFNLSLAPFIPQLVGGALVLRELARIWCLLNLGLMFEILRNIIVFAYCMLLTVGNLRKIFGFVCLWVAIYIPWDLYFQLSCMLSFTTLILTSQAASVKGSSEKLR